METCIEQNWITPRIAATLIADSAAQGTMVEFRTEDTLVEETTTQKLFYRGTSYGWQIRNGSFLLHTYLQPHQRRLIVFP
jgi:hypothetical protein